MADQRPLKDEFLLGDMTLSAGCIFLPNQISIACGREMSEVLECLTQEKVAPGTSDEFKLRDMIMTISGHTRIHRENSNLRYENKILTSINNKVREVNIKHIEGNIRLLIEGGKGRECMNGKGYQWNINLKENKCNHLICVNHIPTLCLYISGVELNVKSYHYSDTVFAIVFENRVRLFGTIKLDEESGVDQSDIDLLSRSFQQSLYVELNNPPSTMFPHLSFELESLWFDHATVKDALELLKRSSI